MKVGQSGDIIEGDVNHALEIITSCWTDAGNLRFQNSSDGTNDVFSITPGDDGVMGDLDGDGEVGPFDLALLLGSWGPCGDCGGCPADLDGDCTVGAADLAILLGNWG